MIWSLILFGEIDCCVGEYKLGDINFDWEMIFFLKLRILFIMNFFDVMINMVIDVSLRIDYLKFWIIFFFYEVEKC